MVMVMIIWYYINKNKGIIRYHILYISNIIRYHILYISITLAIISYTYIYNIPTHIHAYIKC
jgi:hypothetical protein